MAIWLKIGSDTWELRNVELDQAKDLLADAISREGVQDFDIVQDGRVAVLVVNGRSLTHATIWSDE